MAHPAIAPNWRRSEPGTKQDSCRERIKARAHEKPQSAAAIALTAGPANRQSGCDTPQRFSCYPVLTAMDCGSMPVLRA